MPSAPEPQSTSVTLLLAAVAGAVDAIGYATVARLYTAHMTGNTEGFASGLVSGELGRAAWHALPIPIFVAGAIAGAVIARTLRSRRLALAVEAIALIAFMALARDAHGARRWCAAAMPAFAMGLQAVTFRRCGNVRVHTTFITGMLEAFADSFVAWCSSRRCGARARVTLGVFGAYLVGALSGASTAIVARSLATLFPLAGIAVAIVLSRPRHIASFKPRRKSTQLTG